MNLLPLILLISLIAAAIAMIVVGIAFSSLGLGTAGVILLGTLLFCAVAMFYEMEKPIPGSGNYIWITFTAGILISGITASSYWWPI
jgi:hypothetical protein